MGDTDSFVGGAILGMLAAAIALAFLLIAPSRARWQIGAALATAALALVVLWLWSPLAISGGSVATTFADLSSMPFSSRPAGGSD